MKKLLCLLLCLPLMLTGCGEQSSSRSQSQIIEEELNPDRYDSHIAFKVEGASTKEDYEKAQKEMENRLVKALSVLDPTINSFYGIKSIKQDSQTLEFHFNNSPGLSEEDVNGMIGSCKAELRKGNKPDGQLLFDRQHIESALARQRKGENDWVVVLKFDLEGSKLYTNMANAGGTEDKTLTLWIDEKTAAGTVGRESVNSADIIVSGSFTEQSAKELARRINAGYIPYKVSVFTCDLAHRQTDNKQA
ncbi:MAG: hypothetical protein II703_01855 [Ruminococcus sp.]|nr:hypothetical protein [Ruminococcus sp.]